MVQPRKTRPCLTERLLMGRKESNQTTVPFNHLAHLICSLSSSQMTQVVTGNLFLLFFNTSNASATVILGFHTTMMMDYLTYSVIWPIARDLRPYRIRVASCFKHACAAI